GRDRELEHPEARLPGPARGRLRAGAVRPRPRRGQARLGESPLRRRPRPLRARAALPARQEAGAVRGRRPRARAAVRRPAASGVPRMSQADEDALLRGIRAAPEDDLPRLVYADWLDDHGDASRAELIRVQCRLAGLAEDDP